MNKLRAYTCKNGIGNCKDKLGNRDVLDFPLYFKMHEVLNGSGNGNMGDLVNASVDGIDGDANDGSVGVEFVSNHDEGAPPPAADNIAYAHILTRTGYPIVYFNAVDVEPRNFPHDGNDRGYAIWGLKAPRGLTSVEPFIITPVASVIPPDGSDLPNGRRRITLVEKVTADSGSRAARIVSAV
jgi:hypothetical protein